MGTEVAVSRRLGALGQTFSAVGAVMGNRNLRLVQLALLVSLVGDGAYLTAVTVWAYGQGGAQAVGLFTAAFMTASAVMAPVGGAVADRYSRRATLLVCDGVRIVLVVSAAVCLTSSSPIAVYVLAVLAGVFNAPFRAAQRAWMPSLARTPREVTAANAAGSIFESLSMFTGPALGGLVLVVADVRMVFWVNVATFAVSALLVLWVRQPGSHPDGPTRAGESAWAQLIAGFKLLGADADLRNVTGQVAAQTFVAGAARVFLVIVAIEIMDAGARGIGLLDAIIGVGTIGGGVVALARVERERLGRDLTVGVVLWSAPLGLIALWPHPVSVVLALVMLGVANPIVDVSIDTIVMRMTPDHTMARVFAALDSCYIASKALGSVAAPLLLHLVGLRWTLVAVGLPVLVIALMSRRRMVRLDAQLTPPPGLSLLQDIPWFALLTPPTLEALARGLTEVRLPAGTAVITQGEEGNHFYVIAEGTVAVTQEGRLLREQRPGDYFGEIALLQQVRRTATVTATSDVVLRSLDRAMFVGALSGEGLSMVSEVATARLSHRGDG